MSILDFILLVVLINRVTGNYWGVYFSSHFTLQFSYYCRDVVVMMMLNVSLMDYLGVVNYEFIISGSILSN